MRLSILVAVALLLAALFGIVLLRTAALPAFAAPAAPDVFASPINGGCYIAAPNVCKIHVDPFTINIQATSRLRQFTLYANNKPIYDFRTDVSNPPNAAYSPSLVAQDFAATCGMTYTVNIVGQDSLDANPLNLGVFRDVVCPSTVP